MTARLHFYMAKCSFVQNRMEKPAVYAPMLALSPNQAREYLLLWPIPFFGENGYN